MLRIIIKKELKEQYEGYESLIGEISTFMVENGVQPKDVNPFKKAMLWGSIKMKTMMNNDSPKLSEMLVQGTTMGITDTLKAKSEYPTNNKPLAKYIDEIIHHEEEFIDSLKSFL